MEIILVPRYTAETERRKGATTELQHVLSQIVHCLGLQRVLLFYNMYMPLSNVYELSPSPLQ